MVVYENNKLIAVSKNLLNTLNISLEEISQVINKLNLETAVCNKESIEILNKNFQIEKIELLTLKNIDIFKLKTTEKELKIENTTLSSNEQLINASAKEEPKIETNELSLDEQLLNVSPKEEPEIETNELSLDEQLLNVSPKEEPEIETNELSLDEQLLNVSPKEEPEIETNELSLDEQLLNVSPKEEPEIETNELSLDEQLLNVSPKEEPEIETNELSLDEQLLNVSPKEEPEIETNELSLDEQLLNVSPKEEPEIETNELSLDEQLLNVSPKEEPEIETNELSLDEQLLNVSPKEEPEIETNELSLDEQLLNVSPKEEPEIETNELSLDEQLLNVSPKEEPEIKVQQEEVIELSFEDNISECEKIFQKKNIKEIIQKELELASQELGIDEELADELFKDLLTQIINKKDALFKAIDNENYEEIHKIAHFLKGASLNLRLANLAFIFKTIDEEAKNKTDIKIIKDIASKLYNYITPLLNEKQAKKNEKIFSKNKENKLKLDPKIKNFVLNTIRYYLETQDEKKFQKDKKYLEKLLNTKIESIDDLEKILKEN